jgi:hypothetical protein
MRNVTKVEFDAFVAAYPRPLVRDVFGAFEPPLVTYNDFNLAPKWPESVVASHDLDGNGWRINDEASKRIRRSLLR